VNFLAMPLLRVAITITMTGLEHLGLCQMAYLYEDSSSWRFLSHRALAVLRVISFRLLVQNFRLNGVAQEPKFYA
jgi:hypothetical protein